MRPSMYVVIATLSELVFRARANLLRNIPY
jgi:hypothetical protein